MPARLFDGQTARPWPVAVRLTPIGLWLTTAADVAWPDGVPAHWPLDALTLVGTDVPGFLHIRLGAAGGPSLEMTDETLKRALLQQLGRGGEGRFSAVPLASALTLGLLLVALLGVAYWWGLPWLAGRAVGLLPTRFDRALGQRAAAEILASEVEDSVGTARLRAFGQAMQLDTSIRLHVLRTDQLNAFALPGGEIFVFRPLLDSLHRPGELAALLAHELAHVERRHGVQALARATAGYVALSALLGDVGGLSGVLLESARMLGQVRYSRSLEAEADALGCRRLLRLGYSPREMAHLLRRLQATEKGESPVLELLSDHPALARRIATAKALARKQQPPQAPNPALLQAFGQLKWSGLTQ